MREHYHICPVCRFEEETFILSCESACKWPCSADDEHDYGTKNQKLCDRHVKEVWEFERNPLMAAIPVVMRE